ncbi:lipocalin-like domain-containing protein [Vibrio sp. TRT 1302]|uniref:lipocalin-like domain-containing protein n=1 Tax=Vibrio sp. TRT 1302 TaxID=3418504 RepID=UPI003CF70615
MKSSKVTLVIIAIIAIAAGLFSALYFNHSNQPDSVDNHNGMNAMFRSQADKVFEPVLPDNPVVLPEDFAFHNQYQHGWWHFFANVVDKRGNQYGVQWSYFRIANSDSNLSGWQSPQLYISHVVISDKHRVWREQRVARGGIGQAGMTVKPFKLWIDNWFWRSLGQTPFPGLLEAQTDTFGLRLTTSTRGPFVIPGERGYVVKHDLLPIASHNITAPFLNVKGLLDLGGNKVVAVEGKGWMSKEWGSGLLAEGQQGWDWFVFQLDDETTLSVSRYRHDQQLPYLFGTLSTNDGKVVTLTNDQIDITPVLSTDFSNGSSIPMQWAINIPDYGIRLNTQVLNSNLWLPFVLPYWEGPITTTGSHKAKGFMQLTGY